jgi:hypothetical protein
MFALKFFSRSENPETQPGFLVSGPSQQLKILYPSGQRKSSSGEPASAAHDSSPLKKVPRAFLATDWR